MTRTNAQEGVQTRLLRESGRPLRVIFDRFSRSCLQPDFAPYQNTRLSRYEPRGTQSTGSYRCFSSCHGPRGRQGGGFDRCGSRLGGGRALNREAEGADAAARDSQGENASPRRTSRSRYELRQQHHGFANGSSLLSAGLLNVCFPSDSARTADMLECPFSANSGNSRARIRSHMRKVVEPIKLGLRAAAIP